ncbi:hypothetical protein NKG05_17380 [Oerskovia sp. M15]
MRLAYRGTDVFSVLGGEGTVVATVRDKAGKVVERHDVEVSGNPTLYPVLEGTGRARDCRARGPGGDAGLHVHVWVGAAGAVDRLQESGGSTEAEQV